MARNDPQMNLRVPMELKEKIEKAALDNGRTITAEAVYRLEQSFNDPVYLMPEQANSIYNELMGKAISETVLNLTKSLLEEGVSPNIINQAAVRYLDNLGNKKAP